MQKMFNNEAWEQYKRIPEVEHSEKVGNEKKTKAIAQLIDEFEVVEVRIVAAGRKTFEELHPDIAAYNRHRQPTNRQVMPFLSPTPKPWVPTLSFSLPDLDEVSLFQILKAF